MTTKLYHHKTDGGAEYLCTAPVAGTKEGDMRTAIIRLDGGPELLNPVTAAAPLLRRRTEVITEKLVVEINTSGYTGLTPEKVEKALSYYFGSMVRFSVKESAALELLEALQNLVNALNYEVILVWKWSSEGEGVMQAAESVIKKATED